MPCNYEPPTFQCGCDDVPTEYTISIVPVLNCEDNTDNYLSYADGKWWLCSSMGTVIREVSAEEVAAMKIVY